MAIESPQMTTLSDAMVNARAKNAAITGQDVENLSRQMLYSTQALAGAAASGDQGQWENTLNNLNNSGVDVSMFSPDIKQGAQQVGAIRQAMYNANPMNQLLNMGLRAEGNQISAANAMGSVQGGNDIAPTSAAIAAAARRATGGFMPTDMEVPQGMSFPQSSAQQPPDGVIGNSVPSGHGNGRIDDMAVADALRQMGTPQATAASNNPPPLPLSSVQPFFPPPRQDGETQAAYNQRVQNALESYKADPLTLGAQKQAQTTGDINAKDIEALDKAKELTDRLKKNLQGMMAINNSVPSGGLVPQSAKVYMSQIDAQHPIFNSLTGGDNGVGSIASHQWDQLNNQQILSELQQFVASGGANTRINQTIDKIVQAASGIDKTAIPAARAAQINNAIKEIENRTISQGNIVSRQQGTPTEPYQSIPVTVPASSSSNGTPSNIGNAYKNLKSKGYSDEDIFEYLKATGQVK